MTKKTVIIMGNGPSLKNVDFDMLSDYDTYGLNSAYRAYERMNWYPKYFGCFDYIVTNSHRASFQNLVETSPIERFFFLEQLGPPSKVQKVWLLPFGSSDRLPQNEADFYYFTDGGSSGANASQTAVCMGYKKIILVGVDCNYIDFLPETERAGAKLRIGKTPEKNPNYWFDDYQQEGDEYNIPRGAEFHAPTWANLSQRAEKHGIEIVNCSTTTALTCFKRGDLKKELGL